MADEVVTTLPVVQCWNCTYFIYLEPISEQGLCRRHAPPPMNGTGMSSWPVAMNIDWCGEYKSIDDAPVLAARRRPVSS